MACLLLHYLIIIRFLSVKNSFFKTGAFTQLLDDIIINKKTETINQFRIKSEEKFCFVSANTCHLMTVKNKILFLIT